MIKSISNRGRFALVALAVLGASAHARAEGPAPVSAPTPSAGDMESARELVAAARVLRANGDLKAALEKYKAAHALVRTAITGIELARTYADLKMPVEARDVCLEVQRMPKSPAETERSTIARAEAVTLGEEMRVKVASLSIRVALTPPNPNARVVVMLDGREVPSEALGQPRRVNPGSHDISARVEHGEETKRKVDTSEGSSQEVVLHLHGPSAAETPVKPPPGGAPFERKSMSPFVPIGITLGALGLVVGTTGGIAALTTQSELESACSNKQCKEGIDFDATASRAKTWATVSTIGFGVGLVGAALAVVGFLNPVRETLPAVSRRRAPQGVRVSFVPTLGGLRAEGEF